MGEPRRKFVIDVDTGVDDAQALMMALARPDIEVLAVTCVGGNTALDHVCLNTLKVLQVCEALHVPVFRGSSTNLLNQTITGSIQPHGQDGLGNVSNLVGSVSAELVQKEHAVNALIRLANEHDGEITLVALAPLTNVALALRMDESFGTKLKELVIMGGNIAGKGNITPAAEFNFYSDPESAFIVLQEVKTKIVLVSWETCLSSFTTWDWADKMFLMNTKKGIFNQKISEHYVNTKRKKQSLANSGYAPCDAIAMAVALDREAAIDVCQKHCSVELHGALTRGTVVVDWFDKREEAPNVDIVMKVQCDTWVTLFENMLK